VKKKWAERVFSLFLMALAVSAYWQTLILPESKSGLITGSAFFPRWLALLLFICSAIPFARTIIQTTEESETMVFPPPRILLKLFIFMALIGGILLIIPYTGWLGAQLVLVFTVELVFEKRKWTNSLIIAVAAMTVIYGVFELGLGIRLPRGVFE